MKNYFLWQIPSFLGFGGIKDDSGTHIRYKTIDLFSNLVMTDRGAKTFFADYSFNLLAQKQLIYVYSTKIEYQHHAYTKNPLIRVIDFNRCLKNGTLFEIEATNRIVLSNLK